MLAAVSWMYEFHCEHVLCMCLRVSAVLSSSHLHGMTAVGLRLNGQRCEELFMQVFKKFDFSEASHGAVCVEVLCLRIASGKRDRRREDSDFARCLA